MTVKERLITTASDLFYQNGYNNTGINEVIEKAKVAKASLYTHFKTKDDLCIAYLRNKENGFLNDLEVFLKKKPKGKIKILGLFDYLRDVYRQDDFKGSYSINILAEIPKENTKIRNEVTSHRSNFKDFIHDLVKKNTTVKNSDKLTNRLYFLFEGALTESYVEQDSWPIKEAKDLALGLL
ncbi:MAG: TetR/AcrR family transcriptional regulator [Bacteroidia bacterium]|nr:TetR/AcrR family transcriptional regulator [Bacteroidia bacterium]NND10899.1 TetR/AcrR family transcriptional regulator [Flavobacteriaceae bacterium]MBT8308737.1 TetR/AcrR family transcriptional regulator [Bacteroidia bacterium]NNK26868.1 TetR/AcrR family transcriptional regulator [Flavobacteriaceae bacterium]NNL60773.1 TetR/AcrR family transcriptional regulator [Flavobacteriaceae bacterium]